MTTTAVAPEISTPAVTPDHILQTGLAFWASKTLLSAVEMEVFTELARGPETLSPSLAALAFIPALLATSSTLLSPSVSSSAKTDPTVILPPLTSF
jgi:hypothetical protein